MLKGMQGGRGEREGGKKRKRDCERNGKVRRNGGKSVICQEENKKGRRET